ncbi:MAG: hypothetical protein C0463_07140 [Idiomarina sp.]|nr:hypothetical protein [Idiomarina sp.]
MTTAMLDVQRAILRRAALSNLIALIAIIALFSLSSWSTVVLVSAYLLVCYVQFFSPVAKRLNALQKRTQFHPLYATKVINALGFALMFSLVAVALLIFALVQFTGFTANTALQFLVPAAYGVTVLGALSLYVLQLPTVMHMQIVQKAFHVRLPALHAG